MVTSPVMLDLDAHLHSVVGPDPTALDLCYTLSPEWLGITCAPLLSLAHPPVFKNLTHDMLHTFTAWLAHREERSSMSTLRFEVAPLRHLEAAHIPQPPSLHTT